MRQVVKRVVATADSQFCADEATLDAIEGGIFGRNCTWTWECKGCPANMGMYIHIGDTLTLYDDGTVGLERKG